MPDIRRRPYASDLLNGKNGELLLIRSDKKKSVVALEHLLDLLKSYEPGDKLPSEREIASMLSMTRSPVREALIALQIAGMIRIEPGVGGFLVERTKEQPAISELSLLTENESPYEVRQLRQVLEAAIVKMAVSELTEENLKEIEEAYKVLYTAFRKGDRGAYIEAHRDFHFAIAKAANNTLFERLEKWILYEVMTQPIWEEVMYKRLKQTKTRIEDSVKEHELILEAFRSGEAEKAAELLLHHFAYFAETNGEDSND